MYETKKLHSYLTNPEDLNNINEKCGLESEERLLMTILEKEGLTLI